MRTFEQISEIKNTLVDLNDKCAVASGNPSYKRLHEQRVELLMQLSKLVGLTSEQYTLLFGYEAWVKIRGQFNVGDSVSVIDAIGRRGKIVSKHVNTMGTVVHVIEDGGWFSANEIEFDKYASNGGRANVA